MRESLRSHQRRRIKYQPKRMKNHLFTQRRRTRISIQEDGSGTEDTGVICQEGETGNGKDDRSKDALGKDNRTTNPSQYKKEGR